MATKQTLAPKFSFSPQELLALNGQFAVADKNKDGSLDFPEFEKLFSSKVPDAQELKLWFESFDADKSGKISGKEFFSTLAVIGKGSLQDKLSFLFDLFDTDKSGSLTHAEITHVIAYIKRVVLDVHHEGKGAAEGLDISDLDANKDGKITKDEFIAYGLKKPAITAALTLKFH
eukprot:Phypoly_transcript_21658.p1 GENE.Phypoly_transcript_21658~~Phypoly_transcript_21658.p1  ORF type:complete len:174 (+),score=29.87 Phypoly_transcript_21658:84-605(+)